MCSEVNLDSLDVPTEGFLPGHWTHGLDRGLDYGLDRGLDYGLDHGPKIDSILGM